MNKEKFAELQAEFPGRLLCCCEGDFYRFFRDDALTAARILGLTVTKIWWDGIAIPTCGFPYHSLDGYRAKLEAEGGKVVVYTQVK